MSAVVVGAHRIGVQRSMVGMIKLMPTLIIEARRLSIWKGVAKRSPAAYVVKRSWTKFEEVL
jgi:hypothetical protein